MLVESCGQSLSNLAHVGSWLEVGPEFVKLGAGLKLVQSLTNSAHVGSWLEVVVGLKEFVCPRHRD